MSFPGQATNLGSLSDGITVSGQGSVSAPATKATTTIRISSQKPLTTETLRPLIEEIARADGSNDAFTLPAYLEPAGGQVRALSLTGVVDHPTAKMLRDAIPIVAAAFAKAPDITLDNAMVTLTLANCSALMDRARSAAIVDARKRAETIAHDLGVHIGEVKAVLTFDQPQDASGACTSQYFIPSNQEQPMSLDDYVTVRVAERVSIRYAIR
jgi:uncharacterized protein YggE